MPSRRRARELALGALYSAVATDEPPEEPIAASCVRHRMPDDLAGFATRLALRAWERREAHDAAIATHTTHWEPERLVRIDRLISLAGSDRTPRFPRGAGSGGDRRGAGPRPQVLRRGGPRFHQRRARRTGPRAGASGRFGTVTGRSSGRGAIG